MSSFLNSIFFIKKNVNINNVLNILSKFMFTKANQIVILLRSNYNVKNTSETCITNDVNEINESLKNDPCVTSQECTNTIIPKEELNQQFNTQSHKSKIHKCNKLSNDVNESYSPKQPDTLFWCLFIIHFGYEEYLEVDRNYGVKELEIKKQIGEFISKNPHTMKTTGIKMTKAAVQEILSELLTSQKETSINSMMAILVYFKFNLIMVNSTNLLMLEFISDKSNELPTYLLYKDTYGKYSVKSEPITNDEINDMKNKMIHLESYLKPLKSIGNYKVEELEELSKKMGIYDIKKKYKKADLYHEISEACTWL
jgi:hypothetical protein